MSEKILQIKTLSSMAKVCPNRIYGVMNKSCRTLRGQEIAFQVAYRLAIPSKYRTEFSFEVKSPVADRIRVSSVKTAPSWLPLYHTTPEDGKYLTRQSGLFPDPLIPLQGDRVKANKNVWNALWFSWKVDADVAAGNYPVTVVFRDGKTGEAVAKTTYRIAVEDYELPAQKLLFTQWFHCDSIADVHGVPVYSEAHWDLIGKYMRMARAHGMNMILTPVVTPPLDTAIGKERATVQLVSVEKTDDGYLFDCALLRRYIKLALDAGITDFEISHFFTQWGAGFAPKVVAKVKGRMRRIFGWDTPASDPEYARFLSGLIPAVIACFESEGVSRDRLWFHASDEPHETHLEQYERASGILRPLIRGCHHMDALSSYAFYQKNLVERPVVATDHIGAYLEAGVKDLWCYYCCGQGYQVSNRFFSMPSARTRILGVQMYKYGIAGFLHWGYNFYYTEFASQKIDPYAVTDAGGAFPSGDAFSVYPNGNDVAPSLRQKVFSNGLEDMRLLTLLEDKIGREAVLALLERVAGMEITFTQYPCDEKFYFALYDAIFAELKQ